MHIGFATLPLYRAGVSPDVWTAVARAADELGYESLWVGHHLVDRETVHHTTDMHRFDPWVLLANLAAHTHRLRFGSGIYLLPLINPLVTARALMTADVFSKGRMIFGIGVGWNREEYDLVGEDFSTRGRRADEIIEILRRLFNDEVAEFHGRHYDIAQVRFEPKPPQRPHPPLICGGMSDAALARVARVDGCFLSTNDPTAIATAVEKICRYREQAGRVGEPLDVTTVAPLPLTQAAVAGFAGLGVSRVVFQLGQSPLTAENAAIEMTAEALIGNLRSVAERLNLGREASRGAT